MTKLLWLLVLASIGCRLISGRWPWQFLRSQPNRQAALARARELLGVRAGATRQDIDEAHRRLIATVHPDRGGTNALVHEVNDARDILLNELSNES